MAEFIEKAKDQAQQSWIGKGLKEIFQWFCRFGDRDSDADTITLKNIDKWLTQANLMGPKKKITNADTAITFSKVAKMKKRVDFNEFEEILELLAADKKMDTKVIIEQLVSCGPPGTDNVTVPVSSGPAAANLERMTDTKLYTGAHKERFDEEGRGRGIEGREERADTSGYVTGYKEKGAFDVKFKDDKDTKDDRKDDKDKKDDSKDDEDK